MSRKTKLTLLTTLIILIGLALAIFNDSIRAKMFLLYPLTPVSPSANGLVGYWPLDGNALDKSGNGLNGTIVGSSVSPATGKINGAMNFGGDVYSWINAGAMPLNNLTKGSISLWFNANTFTGSYSVIANTGIGSTPSFGFFTSTVDSSTASLRGELTTTIKGRQVCYPTGTLTAGTWYNAVMTYDGSVVKVYVNNVLGCQITGFANEAINPSPNAATSYIGIGSYQLYPGGGGLSYGQFAWNGKIDEIRYYNRALSADEIKQYYDATSAGHYLTGSPAQPTLPQANKTVTSGLLGYWPLDGMSGRDISGNGYNGAITGGAVGEVGKVGSAIQLNGSSGYINLDSYVNNFEGKNTGTLTGWFKTSGTFGYFLTIRDSTTNYQQYMEIGMGNTTGGVTNETMWIQMSGATSALSMYATDSRGSNAYFDGQWHHFALITGDGNNRILIDGVPQSITFGTGNASSNQFSDITGQNTMVIGAMHNNNSYSSYFNGQLDDFRIYNRALTNAEVTQIYQLGQTARVTVNSGAATNNVLTSGLVGQWTFDGPDIITDAVDSSSSGNTGMTTNMTFSQAQIAGNNGQALLFDGVDDNISINDSNSLDLTEDASISVWIKPNAFGQTSGAGGLVSRSSGGYSLGVYSLSASESSRRKITWGKNGADETQSSTLLTAGNWYHIVAIRDSGSDTIYINGVSDNTGSSKGIFTDPGTVVKIGAVSGSANTTFDGIIDDVRIYNRALTSGEVTTLYNTPTTALTDGLVGYWKLDGIIATDRSGNGNNGTFTNIILNQAQTPGIFGQALKFDGTNDYIIIANESNFDFERTNPFSIAAWVKFPKATTDYYIASKQPNSGNNESYHLLACQSCTTANTLRMILRNGASNQTAVHGSTNIMNDQWHHVVGINLANNNGAASDIRLYVDGKIEPTTTTEADTLGANSILNNIALNFGSREGGNTFLDGSIDDVRIYNRALSASEVQQLYNLGR